MKKKKNYDELIDEAIQNIRNDRQETKDLLVDLTAWIIGSNQNPGQSDRHKEVGFTLAKYLEVLQRSNEQLVKIAALSKGKEDNNDLTDDDRNTIFDELNSAVKAPTKKVKK